MNSKPMLFECLDCKETYLADNLCDGYKCPKCNGHITSRGSIKELEESVKDMQDKIHRAKENGLIRKYTKSITGSLAHVPYDGYIAELPFNKCRCGVDYGKRKDITVTVKIDTEQTKKIEDLTKLFDNFNKTKRVGVIE